LPFSYGDADVFERKIETGVQEQFSRVEEEPDPRCILEF
jgi:hypothetical protein